MRKILSLFTGIALLLSCKKEEIMLFSEAPQIYFNLNDSILQDERPGSTARSILVDFSDKPSRITTDTLLFGVSTSGVVSDVDRSFTVEAIDPSDAVRAGEDYELLNQSFFIPSNRYDTVIRMVVHRTAIIQDVELRLRLQLQPNENFQLGPQNDTIRMLRMTDVEIRMRDILLEPANWTVFIATYFGSYSEVKYRFIVDTLEMVSFPSNLPNTSMNNYRNRLRTALIAYNANNAMPLRDENGELITF